MKTRATTLTLAALVSGVIGCAVEGQGQVSKDGAPAGETEAGLAPREALHGIPLTSAPRGVASKRVERLEFDSDDSEVVNLTPEFDPNIAESGRLRAAWREALQ